MSMVEPTSWDAAMKLARQAIYDDGRGMIGRNRNYLESRVARMLIRHERGLRSDIGILLAFIEQMEEAAGENADDEGGDLARIRSDYQPAAALSGEAR